MMRGLAWSALVGLAALTSACGEEPARRYAAKINGDEITLGELNAELQAVGISEGTDPHSQRQAALQRIIERRLLAQAAREDELDQTPEFLIRRRQLEDGVLVQLLERNASRRAEVPSSRAIDAFIKASPALFAERTIFTLDRIQFPTPGDPEAIKQLEDDHSMDAVAAQLRALGIKFTRGRGQLDSARVPQELLEEILSLPRTEPFIFPEGQMVTAAVITGERKEPIVGDQARAVAVRVIRENALSDSMQRALQTARAGAKITYQNGFAPPGSSQTIPSGDVTAQ